MPSRTLPSGIKAEELFRECEFVVASRPGFSLADVANALPASLRPRS